MEFGEAALFRYICCHLLSSSDLRTSKMQVGMKKRTSEPSSTEKISSYETLSHYKAIFDTDLLDNGKTMLFRKLNSSLTLQVNMRLVCVNSALLRYSNSGNLRR